MSERISKRMKRAVIERAHGCCEYCCSQEAFATEDFSVEHIIPQQNSGPSTLENLALSCQGCNSHKYAKMTGLDPLSQTEVTLFHPRQQQWQEHFAWNEDYTLMVGLTETGRATIDTLRTNRPGIVNMRRVLYAVRRHPPQHMQK